MMTKAEKKERRRIRIKARKAMLANEVRPISRAAVAEKIVRHNFNRTNYHNLTRVLAVFGD
jgi:hypothetical protein